VALVCDTNVLLAVLDADEADHMRSVEMMQATREDLVVPVPVLVELDYWLRKRHGSAPWREFVDDVAAGAYRLHHLDERQLQRAAELEVTYDSIRLGLVDAAVIVTCETLGETKVATLDHRHFSVVRPRHCEHLTLLPE
jgi:predicted nucleic acid-binding protein